MFQRLKDTFAFETEFSRWEQLSDIRSALIGNRVAEMYGQSASYGCSLDLYLLRALYGQLRPGAMKSAKEAGLSSKQAALRFLCCLGDEYMRAKGLAVPPERIVGAVFHLAPWYSEADLIPDRWRDHVEEHHARSRKWYEERQAAEPILSSARKEAEAMFPQNAEALGGSEVPIDLARLWAKIPTSQVLTERELSQISGLPLAVVVSWLRILSVKSVVTVSGTALLEPKYAKMALSTLSNEAKKLRDRLDLTLDVD